MCCQNSSTKHWQDQSYRLNVNDDRQKAGSAWCSARTHNEDKLGCFLRQMTWGVLVIWMAGVLQALINGRWGHGWADCGGVTWKGGSWWWTLKDLCHPPFSLSVADWLSGGDETGVQHALCAFGLLSSHIRWLCCHLKLLFYSPAIFLFYYHDLLESNSYTLSPPFIFEFDIFVF